MKLCNMCRKQADRKGYAEMAFWVHCHHDDPKPKCICETYPPTKITYSFLCAGQGYGGGGYTCKYCPRCGKELKNELKEV